MRYAYAYAYKLERARRHRAEEWERCKEEVKAGRSSEEHRAVATHHRRALRTTAMDTFLLLNVL